MKKSTFFCLNAFIALALLVTGLPIKSKAQCNGQPYNTYFADLDGDGFGNANFTSLTEGNSFIVFTQNGVTLTGSNSYSNNTNVNCKITYTSTAVQTVSFSWSYSTTDDNPGLDDAYYFINNVQTPLSISAGANQQSGQVSFAVSNGDTFGFSQMSDDDSFGAATLSITNLNAQIAGQVNSCTQPVGYVSNNTDCSNSNSYIYPGQTESCNSIDDNCNGLIDESVISVYYADVDSDGFGLSNASVISQGNSTISYQADGFTLSGSTGNTTPALVSIGWVVPTSGTYTFAYNYFASANSTTSDIATFSINGVSNELFTSTGGNIDFGQFEYINVQAGDVFNLTLSSAGNLGAASIFQVSFFEEGMLHAGRVEACSAPVGFSLNNNDCQPTNSAINPGATEVCNGVDDNCNGTIDEGVLQAFYLDSDGDGFGSGAPVIGCTASSGYVSNSQDCNDSDANVNTTLEWYVDSDGDGFGAALAPPVLSCSPITGYVSNNSDCDDSNAALNPGEAEICNNIDDNCNEDIDEGLSVNYYSDVDLDGYGSDGVDEYFAPGSWILYTPTTFVLVGSQGVFYGVSNTVQFTAPLTETYTFNWAYAVLYDPDQDPGYYFINDQVFQLSNEWGANYQSGVISVEVNAGDIFGFGINSLDNEPGPVWLEISNFSARPYIGIMPACSQPVGYVLNNTDCNNSNVLINPGATEICNEIDDDCDGVIDDGALITYFADADGDGFGGTSEILACTVPAGYSSNNLDCNENLASINPSASEICNGADENCNGQLDEGVQSTFYYDGDNDGFGTSQVFSGQSAQNYGAGQYLGFWGNTINFPTLLNNIVSFSYSITNTAAMSQCVFRFYNGDNLIATVDAYPQNGETISVVYNFTSPLFNVTSVVVFSYWNPAYLNSLTINAIPSSISACAQPAGYVSNNTDCNDYNLLVNPGVFDICNAVDDNCDTQVDNGLYYADNDGDSFGFIGAGVLACSADNSYVTNSSDCNDNFATINPNATETCNGIDDDCDTQIDEGVQNNYYADTDGDGYGAGTATAACTVPAGFVTTNTDCNNTNASVNPAGVEICNNIDDDCDTQVDEGVQNSYYADTDGDGFGAGEATLACAAPNGYVTTNTDCNNTNSAVFPGAIEICNDIDDDCDSEIDGVGAPVIPVAVASCGPYTWSENNTTYTTTGTYYANIPAATTYNSYETFVSAVNGAGYQLSETEDFNGYSGYMTSASGDLGIGFPTWTAAQNQGQYPAIYAAAISGNPAIGGNQFASPVTVQFSSGVTGVGGNFFVVNNFGVVFSTELSFNLSDGTAVSLTIGSASTFTGFTTNGPLIESISINSPYVFGPTNPYVYLDNLIVATGIPVLPCGVDVLNLTINTPATYYADADGDGYGAGAATNACAQPNGFVATNTDCNDANSAINTAAPEVCNGIDDDCDTQIDEGVQNSYYADTDGDGFGAGEATLACAAPNGYVTTNTDCNNANSAVFPGAIEICNDIDDDCDSEIDGVGAPVIPVAVVSCSPYTWSENNTTYTTTGTYYANIPAATTYNSYETFVSAVNGAGYQLSETEDFNGYSGYMTSASGDLGIGFPTWTAAQNQGQYPGIYATSAGGSQTIGGNAYASPVVIQFSSGVTGVGGNFFVSALFGNVLNATVDINLSDGTAVALTVGSASTFTGFTTNGLLIESITINTPFVNGSTNPYVRIDNLIVATGIPVLPCGVDVLNLTISTPATYYADEDGDGYGAGSATNACAQPIGFVSTNTDCNDANSAVNVAAIEICNTIDDDCDTQIDEGVQNTYYADTDGDGYGGFEENAACTAPVGYVITNTDCNNSNASVYPGATEICNNIDDDCDTQIDEGLSVASYFEDEDGDGYGAGVAVVSCSQSAGYVTLNNDCDDSNEDINPASTETCNSFDDDCDNQIDEGLLITYYADLDGDGYGAGSATNAASIFAQGNSSVTIQTNQITISGSDGGSDNLLFAIVNLTSSSSQTVTFNWQYSSLDDAPEYDPAYYQINGNQQILSALNGGVDQSGLIQLTLAQGDVLSFLVVTVDDSYGEADLIITNLTGSFNTTINTCSQPVGYVLTNTDCNNNSNTVYPGASEICGNNVDENCDGVDPPCVILGCTDVTACNYNVLATISDSSCLYAIVYYGDFDGDGFGSTEEVFQSCEVPDGYVSNSLDCNDENEAINVTAVEVCNGIDDDCDTQIDEEVQTVYFIDIDGDTYGNSSVSILACMQPVGYTQDDTDCNDFDANVNPGAEDIAGNGIDENCDGQTDNNIIEYNASANFYPNPTRSELNLQVNHSLIGSNLYIFDSIGKLVYKQQLLSSNTSLSVSNFADGYYVMKVGDLVMRFEVMK